MAAPPWQGQSARREELAQSPHDAGEHDLVEGYARKAAATMRISAPEPGGAGHKARFDLRDCLAESAIVQEMFSSTRVPCGARVATGVGSMRLARSLSILSVCLVAISALAGHLNTAAAQQPEKRIALVVGNAAYSKSPLATAANDSGPIAQTMQ